MPPTVTVWPSARNRPFDIQSDGSVAWLVNTASGIRNPAAKGRKQASVAIHPASPGSGVAETGLRPRRSEKAALAAAEFFKRHEQDHEAQNASRNLGGATKVATLKPDREDAGRQGLHGKEIDGAEIVDRFHHHNRHTGRDGGPRQRQADTDKPADGPNAKGPRHLVSRAALLAKGRAGKDIDIGIECGTQDDDRRATGADGGKPIVLGVVPTED